LEIFHAGITTADWFMLFKTQFLQDILPKGCVAFLLLPEKNIFAPFGGTPGRFPQIFMQCLIVVPHLYSKFCPNRLRFWLKTLPRPAKVIAVYMLF